MLKPRTPIRRFDVFAEYNRQKAIEDGRPEDEAAGYGLWVAKVVASRGFGSGLRLSAPSSGREVEGQDAEESKKPEKPKWHTLGGEEQTDELFDREIIKRMGHEFYDQVFVPAIEAALREDKSYTSIRDTIRKDWKP
jgi:hypothetical protein